MLTKAAVQAVLTFLAVAEHSRGAANDNIKHFATVCELVRLTQTTAPTPAAPPSVQTDLNEILMLNLTTSDETWRQRFEGEPTDLAWPNVEKSITDSKTQNDWKNRWKKWLETSRQLKAGAAGSRWSDKNKPLAPGYAQRVAKAHLNKLSAAATQLDTEITDLITQQTSTDIDGAKKALKAALCATGPTEESPHTVCTNPTETPFDKTTSCTANKAGLSIGNDLACLCLDNTGGACAASLGADKLSTNALAANAMKDTLNACPSGTKVDFTNLPAAIEAALHRTAALLSLDDRADKATLGKTGDGNCDTSSKICVAYESYYKNPNSGFESIPWVKELRAAQQHILSYTKKEQRKAILAARLADMKTTAEAAYQAGQLSLPLSKTDTGKSDPAADETTKSETKCPKKNATAAQCPSADCDYDENKKECKPKPGKETTAAGAAAGDGAADGTNTEGKKCSRKEN
uniref:Variant surface glycoprotein 1198 n=1 Tax=Trypanosoma brucei TaxID=5691 RepID=M4SXW7_9TRYP|nr:variant surface glycoprotein 1198 [Trypanosoma brucei]